MQIICHTDPGLKTFLEPQRELTASGGPPEPAAQLACLILLWNMEWSKRVNRQPGELWACMERAFEVARGVQRWRKWMCHTASPGSWIHFPHPARSFCAGRMKRQVDGKRHLKVPGVKLGVWRPHWEPHAAYYRSGNKNCRFLYFLSNSLICGSSAPSVSAPLAGSALLYLSHLPLLLSSLHHSPTSPSQSAAFIKSWMSLQKSAFSISKTALIICGTKPALLSMFPTPEEGIIWRQCCVALNNDYKQSFCLPPNLSLDQVPGSRAVCPDQIVLVLEKEGLHSQPALRAVVRNSPVKLLAGFVQQRYSLHSTAAP